MNVLLPLLCLMCFTAIVSSSTHLLFSEEDICRFYADGTFLIKPGYCDRGIQCIDSKSVELSSAPCSGTKAFFDPADGTCMRTANTDACSADKDPCVKNSNTIMNDPYNCDGWITCMNGTAALSGKCATGQYYDQEKQACVYSSQTTCTATFDICDITAVGVKFHDTTNCSQYLICEKSLRGNVVSKIACPTGTYYHKQTGECIATALAACDVIPTPYEICGTIKLAVRDQFVSDRATCRGYFYCKDLGSRTPDPSPQWGRCPENTLFNEEWEACIDRAYTKCPYDRCDGRESKNELSEVGGCQHYYECQDNTISVGPIKCENNQYFDEFESQCTNTRKTYSACS